MFNFLFGLMFSGMALMFIILGIVFEELFVIIFTLPFLLIGLIFMWDGVRIPIKSAFFLKFGKLGYAKVKEIHKTNRVINGRPLCYLICDFEGQDYKSEKETWFSPELLGHEINIYYINDKFYFLDTRTL